MDKKATEIVKLLLADVTDKSDLKTLKSLLPEVIDFIASLNLSTQDYALPKLFVKVYCETKETDYNKIIQAFVYWHRNELPKIAVENNLVQDNELYAKRFVEDYKNKLSLMKI